MSTVLMYSGSKGTSTSLPTFFKQELEDATESGCVFFPCGNYKMSGLWINGVG
ncbi:hypothetical protein [Aquibacillus albus]|uniref:Uncharacterized protein n=1 Tax=Aquibacillus albus TaxID=1168171 RepID=A0ABS2N4W3_9BACI|nr:hypothetical protein [Aquibacillus albus]MBM7573151.1 hypothetical protein [Aquibacillus albus]